MSKEFVTAIFFPLQFRQPVFSLLILTKKKFFEGKTLYAWENENINLLISIQTKVIVKYFRILCRLCRKAYNGISMQISPTS